MSTISHFTAKRKIYLNNRTLFQKSHILQDKEPSRAFSKALVYKTITEFNAAVYNDHISGLLLSSEEQVKARLYPKEYYLELLVPAESISETLDDGCLFIHAGYTPKIVALKTAEGDIYIYDDKKMKFCTEKLLLFNQQLLNQYLHHQKMYNHNPKCWSLRHLDILTEAS